MIARLNGRLTWSATLALLALSVAPALAETAPAPTASPRPTTVYRYTEDVIQVPGTRALNGYVVIGGNQAFIIHPITGMPLDARYLDIRNRILGVLQPGDSNTAIQVAPSDITVKYQGMSPVVFLKGVPIITVTNEDAAQARTDPQLLANQWAAELQRSIANYKVGEPLPEDYISMRLVPGNYPGTTLPQPAVNNDSIMGSAGTVRYDVKNGVVTLNGTVASNFERAMAELQVRRIPGVVRVVNNLEVRSAPQPVQQPQAPVADNELRRQVGQQLLTIIRMNSPVPTPNGP